MNIILKCSRVAGSALALVMLGGIWFHYARLVSGVGGIARAYQQVPDHFIEQLFVLLAYTALLLLLAFPFSRVVSAYWWRIVFGLLAGFSLCWFVLVLVSRSIGSGSLFAVVSVFLVSQVLSVWLQRHPSATITPLPA